MQQYRLGSDWLVNNLAEKEVGVLVEQVQDVALQIFGGLLHLTRVCDFNPRII